MLPPEVIDRLQKEKEERDRPVLQIPLYLPEISGSYVDEEAEKEDCSKIIVIDLV
jgi:hypothetical protein